MKRKLKNWVFYTIITINFMNIIIATGEWSSLLYQCLFVAYSLVIGFASYKIVKKYGKEVF